MGCLMSLAHDLSDRIERSAEAERHFGVSLESLSAFVTVDEDGSARMAIAGEVVAPSRGNLVRNLHVLASAHDPKGRVLGVWKETIGVDGFYEFQAFAMSDYSSMPSADVANIKIYPCGY